MADTNLSALIGQYSGVAASGAGELNMVSSPSQAAGWTGATGGSIVTSTTAADLPLQGIIPTAVKMTSSNGLGVEATLAQTFSFPFTTPASYAVKTKVDFWMRPGANFLGSEWTVSVYQGSTRVPLTTDSSAVTRLPTALGKFTAYFDAQASTAYTLRFCRTANPAPNLATLNVANVIVGPGIQPQGAVVGPWISYTPVVTNLGAGSSTNEGWYRRIGDTMELKIRILKDTTAGTGSTAVQVSMPIGLTCNFNLLPSSSILGFGQYIAATYTGASEARINGSSQIYLSKSGAGTNIYGSDMSASSELGFSGLMIPINEWSGSSSLNVVQNDVIYCWPVGGTWGTSSTQSTGQGQGGVLGGTTTPSGLQFGYTFPAPTNIPAGCSPQIEVSSDGIHFSKLGALVNGFFISSLYFDGTQYNGIGFTNTTNNNLVVTFGKYPAPTLTWSNIGTWYFRVVYALAGQAIGFGAYQPPSAANPVGSSGLIPASGYPGRLDQNTPASLNIGEKVILKGSYNAPGTGLTVLTQINIPSVGEWEIVASMRSDAWLGNGANNYIGISNSGSAFDSSDADARANITQNYTTSARAQCNVGPRCITDLGPYFLLLQAQVSGSSPLVWYVRLRRVA